MSNYFVNIKNHNMTLGEKRVRTTFNPDNNGKVDQVKQKSAELINIVDSEINAPDGVEGKDLGEFIRLNLLQ